jgi:hypothetical protein
MPCPSVAGIVVTMKPRNSAIASLAVLLAVAVAPKAVGRGLNANDGDVVFGKADGVRYAADSATYDNATGSAEAVAGCGASGWRVIGGGTDARRPPGQSWISLTGPLGFDRWRSQGTGSPGGRMLGYSICVHDDLPIRIRYRDDPDEPTGRRSGALGCGAPDRWNVAGGGAALFTSGSWVSTSFPWDGKDEDRLRDDGWQAAGWDSEGGTGTFEVHLICVRAEHVRTVHREPIGVAAGAQVTRRVACANDEHVTGGGAHFGGLQDLGRLVASLPYDDADPDDIPDDGWQVRAYNIDGADKQVTAFAICFSP